MEKLIIHLDKEKTTISPEIYGQFAEHLGHCIYEGIFVGEDSLIPNVNGMRRDVVDALKHIKVPVIRWPGGCFADEYHWKDGIGPKDQRPHMVNSNWGGVVEDNSFGTHEFMELCEQVGAAPYINGNLGSGTVQEMQDWIEYMTCADMQSTLAKWRAENGREEAWSLKWFGVGNENWGCGGSMCPQYYAQEYKRYRTFLRNYGDNRLSPIACGPSDDDYKWMETMIQQAGTQMDHISLHYYTIEGGNWEHKGKALEFDRDGYMDLMAKAWYMEDIICHHLSILDRYDPNHRIGLIVDEWGTWHQVEEGTHPGFLFQQNTLRDALVASMSLDIFNQHADRITMANIAQMVNVLQSMVLTRDDQMILTPTYHIFDLYKDHQGAKLLDSWTTASMIEETIGQSGAGEKSRDGKNVAFPSITHTASRKGKTLNLTVSNFSPDRAQDLTIELFGKGDSKRYEVKDCQILYSPDTTLNAHNSFDNPDAIGIEPWSKWQMQDGELVVQLPAASVVKVVWEEK
jgi:alpha-N-arabinofuranosidase